MAEHPRQVIAQSLSRAGRAEQQVFSTDIVPTVGPRGTWATPVAQPQGALAILAEKRIVPDVRADQPAQDAAAWTSRRRSRQQRDQLPGATADRSRRTAGVEPHKPANFEQR